MTKNRNHIKHQARKWACVLALSAVLPTLFVCMPAHADDDPFQIDTAHWMSFDHYKDADKRGMLDLIKPAAPEEAARVIQPSAIVSNSSPAASATLPAVATPTRPIDLPVMPGLNKGFNVNITSTEDAHPSVPLVDVNQDKPDLELNALSDKNWQSPTSIKKAETDDSDSDKPLNVRMSFLPNQNVPQTSSAEHPSAQKLGHEEMLKALASKSTPVPTKTPAEMAACAAIDAYKKQQLIAIQSDRQTLKALQDAVHSLGLDKQLDFMAGNSSTLNVSGTQPTAPTSTTIR